MLRVEFAGTDGVRPVTDQMPTSGGKRIPVTVAFSLYDSSIKNSTVGFSLGQYNPFYPLMIDPTLNWNTFLRGAKEDHALAITMDDSGNVYVAGLSYATWGSPIRAFAGGWNDVFVAKLSVIDTDNE